MTDFSEPVLGLIEDDEQAMIDLCLRLGNARDYAGDELEVGQVVVAHRSSSETRVGRVVMNE